MEITTPLVTLKLSVVCLKAISQANSGRERPGTRWASIVDIAVLALSRLTQPVLPLCFHSEPCFISLAALVDEAGPSDFVPTVAKWSCLAEREAFDVSLLCFFCPP